jgi:hypothetical protein
MIINDTLLQRSGIDAGWIAATLSALVPVGEQAQDPPEASADLQEIVVTARKREKSLQRAMRTSATPLWRS